MVTNVALWLRGLGLEQYAPGFVDNDIDAAVLPELTAEDLIALGVTSVGHRRRLLSAIATLRDRPPEVVSPSPAAIATIEAERRQLTVMFCDLVGSTALSTRFDPEDLREVIGTYHATVAEEVRRFGGFIAKYMGDGVLTYFGYPQAHEDDAERAVRTGLALAERVARLVTRASLETRIGIATGLVVVGDLIGEGEAQERGVVGETPNLASRMQNLAPPNGVVIAEGTRRLLGDLFELRDLGAVALKGFHTPVPIWQVMRPSGVESRFEALRAAALTPLVGREEELDLLLRRWKRAKAGEGQVVLLSGEPGIGKSRLTAALHERLAEEPHTRLRYFCSPHHSDSALYPIIAQLEHAAGFERDDPPEAKFQKLEDLLAPAVPSEDDMALLGELLSLPAAERHPALQPSAAGWRERTFEALVRQLASLALRQPVLMVYEDLHWADPSLRDLLDLTVTRVAQLPVLLLITFRPEFLPPWSGLPNVTALTLSRLDARTGAAMVDRIVGNHRLPADLAAEIVQRTDGVPLFVEELTKAVLEAGPREEAISRTLSGAPLSVSAVPAALHASLMARLDRLGHAAREVAQAGAAIGRDFSYALLRPILRLGDEELCEALNRLTESGLVFRRGTPPQATFLFKHALVRDAAYSTLLRDRRRQIHAGIADVLKQDFPEIVAAQPEALAYHSTEAGLTAQAVDDWRRAGEHAIERSANLEAISHLSRGLQILKTLPESWQRDEQELVFQVALLAPHWASKGFASPGAEQVAARAEELCQRVGGHLPEHIRALWGVAAFHLVSGELRTGFAAGERCLQLAEQLQDRSLLGHAQFLMGNFLLWFAELVRARGHLEQGIALYDPQRARFEAAHFGFQDHNAACYSFLGRVLWHLGYPEQAKAVTERSIAIANDSGHPFSIANALSWAAALRQLCGEVGRTRELSETDLAFSTERVIPFFAAHAMVLLGWALVMQGRGEEGIAQLGAGLAAYRATGSELERPHWLGLMVEACGNTGRIEEGLHAVAEALELTERTGIVYYEAELYRLEGQLRLRPELADAPAAEMCFRRAIDIARKQQAKSWELRAATSLAGLWRDQGRRAEARDLLAPIYGWFTEGFDTVDLRAAKALLDEVNLVSSPPT